MALDFIKDFRNAKHVNALVEEIKKESKSKTYIMEVCGGHTHTIMKYGVNQLLRDEVEFVHGPGCPVCVMPKERIDHAIALAQMSETILVTLGDMIRVPGSKSSLQKERAKGADVRVVYSPLDALSIANENPEKKVVYFAIGFETTTPMTAALAKHILEADIKNLFLHVNHVLVPPAVDAIMADGEAKIDAFLGPSHVSVITGSNYYNKTASDYKTPVVVSGFEPTDVVDSVLRTVKQVNANKAEVENQYTRAVTPKGNINAQKLIDTYMQRREHFRWRGIGDIPNSALKLRDAYAAIDAEVVFKEFLPTEQIDDHKACLCGQILKGLAKPNECKVFAKGCTPQNPMGSCMVSSEGACSAYFKYGKLV